MTASRSGAGTASRSTRFAPPAPPTAGRRSGRSLPRSSSLHHVRWDALVGHPSIMHPPEGRDRVRELLGAVWWIGRPRTTRRGWSLLTPCGGMIAAPSANGRSPGRSVTDAREPADWSDEMAVESLAALRVVEGEVGSTLSDNDIELAAHALRPGTDRYRPRQPGTYSSFDSARQIGSRDQVIRREDE
jgi:hypothetical protein